MPAGTIPAYVGGYSTGDAAGRTWYVLDPNLVTRTEYRYYIRDTEHYYAYMGADLVLTKRLSNKWMANFSFTYQDQKDHWGKYQGDPTNKWALDNGVYAAYTGGASGKFNQYIFSKWLVKLSGMYQLPFGFNISATFNARQGNMIPNYFTIQDDRLTGIQNSNTIYIQKLDQDRLPTFWEVNLRLEKMFRLGDLGKIWLMADVFNLFNKQLVTRRSDGYLGIFHVDTGILIPYAQYQENLNPLLLRLGVRFEL